MKCCLPNPLRQPKLMARSCPANILCFVLLTLLFGLLTSFPAKAQVLGWGGLEGNLDLGYEHSRQETKQQSGVDSGFTSDFFREQLNLRTKRVYLMDPRLILVNVDVSIGLFQDNNDFNGGNTTQKGRLHNYELGTTFFSQKPYSLKLYANQTESRVSRNFGTRTNINTSSKGARATLNEQSFLKDMGFPFFNTSLEVSQVKIDENSIGNGQDFRRNEQHDVLQYDVSKGFETADFQMRYRVEDIQDTQRTDNGFTNQMANLNYGLDFGPTLNRRWTSINTYVRRTGLNSNDSVTANQNLLIHHNVNLTTNYQYTYSQFKTMLGLSKMHSANIAVTHRLYRNLTSGLNVQGNAADLPEGTTKSYGAGPTFNYRRQISRKGRLLLRVRGNYRINENDLSADTVQTNNEFHQVAAEFPVGDPGFLLDELFVVAASIIIVDRRGGSQLPTTPGIDYEVIVEGDRTRIRPLPTSAVLQANDPLEVSYRHRVAPSLSYSTRLLSFNGSVDFGWIAFSAGRSVSDQSLRSGIDSGLLQDTSTTTVDLRVRGKWRRLQASADGGYKNEDSSRQQYTMWHFGQSVTLAGFHAFTLSASASENFTRFTRPRSRDIESYTANIALDGTLRAWQTRVYAGLLILNDPDIEDQTTVRAGIKVRRDIGRLTITGDLLWNEFDRESVTSTGRLIGVHAIRRF